MIPLNTFVKHNGGIILKLLCGTSLACSFAIGTVLQTFMTGEVHHGSFVFAQAVDVFTREIRRRKAGARYNLLRFLDSIWMCCESFET